MKQKKKETRDLQSKCKKAEDIASKRLENLKVKKEINIRLKDNLVESHKIANKYKEMIEKFTINQSDERYKKLPGVKVVQSG